MKPPRPKAEIVATLQSGNMLWFSVSSADAAKWVLEEGQKFGRVIEPGKHPTTTGGYWINDGYCLIVNACYDPEEIRVWIMSYEAQE